MFGWDNDKQQEKPRATRGPSGKNIVGPKTTPGINAKTCGNIVAGLMDAISFLLTRSPVLALNDEEEKDMGESLYETISNFPATSVSVKCVNYLAPWAGVVHTGSRIIWKRLAFIAQVKEQTRNRQVRENRNPFPQQQDMVYAPDPARVN